MLEVGSVGHQTMGDAAKCRRRRRAVALIRRCGVSLAGGHVSHRYGMLNEMQSEDVDRQRRRIGALLSRHHDAISPSSFGTPSPLLVVLRNYLFDSWPMVFSRINVI